MRSDSVSIFGDSALENFSHADTDALPAEGTILALCFAVRLREAGEFHLPWPSLPSRHWDQAWTARLSKPERKGYWTNGR